MALLCSDEEASALAWKHEPGHRSVNPAIAVKETDQCPPELRARLRVAAGTNGVVVTEIRPNSAAARSGVAPGDVIQQVNRKPVATVEEFERLYRSSQGDVLLLIQRQGQSIFLVLKR